MLGAHSYAAADGRTHDDWYSNLPSSHVPEFRRVVHDLIHGDGHEVGELKFDDRSCSCQGTADTGTCDGGL